MIRNRNKNSSIIIEDSLQSYFFEHLDKFNRTLSNSLPIETIYYSSYVLNKYSSTANYFEKDQNGLRDKILGIKLLEVEQLSKAEKKAKLKDIGDTSLCLLGVFSESVNKKILDESYYAQVGISAYTKLNSIEPNYMDVPDFYRSLSAKYLSVVELLSVFTRDFFKTKTDNRILKVS